MELEVLRHYGIPESGIISIRAGSTRRQAQLSSLDRPLKFPCGPDESQIFKVDVLDLLGTARLAYDPVQSEYSLALEPAVEGADHVGMEVAFSVRRAGEGRGGGEGDTFYDTKRASKKGELMSPTSADAEDDKDANAARELSAREYLEKHGLTTFMQFLMQGLMKDKPADPYSFLQKQVTKRMVSELSKSVGGSEEEQGLDALLSQINAEAPQVSTEQLETLEREAAATSEQLRMDNKRLRETAAQLKSRYWQLLEETDMVASPAAGAEEKKEPLYKGPGLPPLGPHETPQLAAYREIAGMQTEVSSLAKENGALVEELARMRGQIDAVRGDIEFMTKEQEQTPPAVPAGT